VLERNLFDSYRQAQAWDAPVERPIDDLELNARERLAKASVKAKAKRHVPARIAVNV
jgi:hypothetical protein